MKILVLDLPALHIGYLGCYGNDWVATPNMDRLASESVVFDRHYYDVAQPSPFAWTGHHPFPMPEQLSYPPGPNLGALLAERGLLAGYCEGGLVVSLETLQEIVSKTLSALENKVTWVRFPSLAPPWDLPLDLLDSYCEEDDEPWPDPPNGFLENAEDVLRLQNTYAAVVTYVDAHLGVLLDALREQQLLDDMLVCLTAASGLPLGEHGIVGFARPWAHEELVHLPLLLRLPGAEAAGLRLDALTQPVDLFPTLLAFLDISPPPSHGHDLGPLIRAEVNQVRPYACSGMHTGDAMEWALRTLDWAFLLPLMSSPQDPAGQPRLYVKPDDRWEVNDVQQHHLELMEEMEKMLREFAVLTQKPGPLTLNDRRQVFD